MSRCAQILTALVVTWALAGCGEDSAESDAKESSSLMPEPTPASLEEVRGFFNPKKNEVWTYRVTREVPGNTILSDEEALRVIAKHENHYELAFERKRICGGPVTLEGSDEELLLVDIYENGALAEQEYYEITPEGLFGRGWSGQPGKAPSISTTAIPIAVPAMVGGMMWRTSAEENARHFRFRVIERTTLELPAGTFDVAQVQITSSSLTNSFKRTLWFADNVGIVKEVTTHYDANTIRLRETSELVSWTLPNAAQAQQEEEDAFKAEATSTGPSSGEDSHDEL